MSIVKHLKKEQQQIEPLFNGAFTENKPIPFPNRQGTSAYSNIFYWAHLVAHETAEFPLHPHEGFEIMTFVFKGTVEHYDTASQVYTPLKAGDVQAIQAGSGVSHSERITKGTELFQIWFDPDFSQTLKNDASYKDYSSDSLISKDIQGGSELVYVGETGNVYSQTEGLEIKKLSLQSTKLSQTLDKESIYSFYLLEGSMSLNANAVIKDDFLVLRDEEELLLEVKESAELFVIKTPKKLAYSRFIQRYQNSRIMRP